MAVVVNVHNEFQEDELVSFLDEKKYDFKTNDKVFLTEQQAEQILQIVPQTTTEPRSWEDIRKELKSNVVTLIREAGIDIETPCYWYESPHIGLAGVLLNEIDNYFDLISQNPLL
ncbi:hypothetical protein [Mucilaginibacter ginkgonis]|uniref:Uncharacterized protein n=1 Tax=Mucilaginibacter ginkgonis TaxID=2682091 RepID=A0A6I4HWK0_9SPHI|nr:hypothetical protein [Mucilaginibacter ginkgonis]QQL50044.1 hypothetical protein GO620_000910 [Mucilaginibacter ginkgonis]